MSIEDEIGQEVHPHLDQMLVIVEGVGEMIMGTDRMSVGRNSAIIVPANTLHNLINKGSSPIKLYSIYAPVQHPHGTVHRTRKEAEH